MGRQSETTRRRLTTIAAAILAFAWAASVCASTPLEAGVSYLRSHQQADGGFAEPGRSSTAGLTAWAVLALEASGIDASASERSARDYLVAAPTSSATDLELRLIALAALGDDVTALADEIDDLRKPDGRIGAQVNSTIWGVIALAQADRKPGSASVSFLLHQQRKSGGWAWSTRAAPDCGDTAAAVQALRAAGLSKRSQALVRAVRYLKRCQNPDGGFGTAPGNDSDAQSTAWAIQGLLATGVAPGKSAFRYLARLQQPNGSYRYNTRYEATPVWVTAQVVCALARKPFPF
jgi:prenyltransferase beta subunit